VAHFRNSEFEAGIMTNADFTPEKVLDFWFGNEDITQSIETFGAFWHSRMQGEMDEAIIADFPSLTKAAARGELDHWADTALGRMALIIALDQFPRSLWRDTPAAFGQDIKSATLALEGIKNGHYQVLEKPWMQVFYLITISHCEGPDHLARLDQIDELTVAIEAKIKAILPEAKGMLAGQNDRVRKILETFGRHPHRNEILGRISTISEESYIEAGEFPHLAATQQSAT
jgi:uncharacterized protein (DUF924 family)